MKFFDNHTHSTFSPDSIATVEQSVKCAMEGGLAGIAITDHLDYEVTMKDGSPFDFDVKAQQLEIDRVAQMMGLNLSDDGFRVLKGVELGLQDGLLHHIREWVGDNEFDTVIASLHTIDGLDPYVGTYYGDKNFKEAYGHALEVMYKTAVEYGDFDILGHFDYVARYSPYGPGCRDITMEHFGEQLEMILKYLAQNGKTFEINTKTYMNHKGYIPVLDKAILKRFRELGGEAISLGSDSHNTSRYGDKFEEYVHIIKECGFRYLVYYQKRKPHYYKIEL